jgi:ribosomal protein L37AE/L43A
MTGQVRQVAEKYLVNIKSSGDDNLRAQCPFCESKRAFIMSQENGLWVCFSCNERGGLASFLRRMGLSRESIEKFVKALGSRPEMPEYIRRKLSLSEDWQILPEWILGAYDTCPTQLTDAGFSEDILYRHDVGYDSNEDRITFALRDYLGRLIGVSGRAYEDSQIPRYKIYTDVYESLVPGYSPKTRSHLYGFHDVYAERYFSPDIDEPIIVVEGYKGCLWMRQMGFRHTVALQGSSMTKSQERMLTRVRGPKYILLDHEVGKSISDRFGSSQTVTIARRLANSGRVLLCDYGDVEEGISPDDLSQNEALEILNNAKTLGQRSARYRQTWSRQ